MQAMKTYACENGKTVITSVHQPSSQMFGLFDRVLLLAEGKLAYFGYADGATKYFEGIGLHCPLQYNIADFMRK